MIFTKSTEDASSLEKTMERDDLFAEILSITNQMLGQSLDACDGDNGGRRAVPLSRCADSATAAAAMRPPPLLPPPGPRVAHAGLRPWKTRAICTVLLRHARQTEA